MPLWAGTVTTLPAHKKHKLLVAKDQSVSFTATSESGGTLTTSITAENGATTSGEGATRTVTFGLGTVGKKTQVTFTVTHVVDDAPCTTDRNFVYDVYVPEIQLNDTPETEDDLIAVSSGDDADLATNIRVNLSGASGFTVNFSLKDSDGDVTFEEGSMSLDGTGGVIKAWGVTPSSAQDKTILVAQVTTGEDDIGSVEKPSTVFEGVSMSFEGNFASPIDSRAEGWRPRADLEAPPEDAQYPPGTSAQDIQNWSSKIQFQPGDQGLPIRAWAPAPSVAVTKVTTLSPPDIEVPGDPLIGAKISLTGGGFEHNVTPGTEKILDFACSILGNNKTYLAGTIAAADVTALQNTAGDGVGIGDQAAATAYINKVADGPTTTLIKQYYLSRLQTWVALGKAYAEWTNEKLAFTAGADIADSILAKGFIGAQDKQTNKVSSIKLFFARFNIWDLVGKVEEGEIKNGSFIAP